MKNLPQETKDLVEKTLDIKSRIDEIKNGRLAQLEATYDMYLDKVQGEMRRLGEKTFETLAGSIKWSDVSGRLSLDEKAVCKALNIESLDRFKSRGESSVRMNVKLAKPDQRMDDNINNE